MSTIGGGEREGEGVAGSYDRAGTTAMLRRPSKRIISSVIFDLCKASLPIKATTEAINASELLQHN